MNESSYCSISSLAFGIISFLDFAILIDVQWYVTAVSMFIFLMTYDVEHLCICLFASCISTLLRCLFSSLAHFFFNY